MHVKEIDPSHDQHEQTGPLSPYWHLLVRLLSFRLPMRVSEYMILPDNIQGTAYYVCPRCHITLEREFQAFCDRCGQRLDWDHYEEAILIPPGRH